MQGEFHQNFELFRRELNVNAVYPNPSSSNIDEDIAKVDGAGQERFLEHDDLEILGGLALAPSGTSSRSSIRIIRYMTDRSIGLPLVRWANEEH
jgi:hypothetical protein